MLGIQYSQQNANVGLTFDCYLGNAKNVVNDKELL